ncbi:hypothetical protein SLA2020_303670 [Shorea laevis]
MAFLIITLVLPASLKQHYLQSGKLSVFRSSTLGHAISGKVRIAFASKPLKASYARYGGCPKSTHGCGITSPMLCVSDHALTDATRRIFSSSTLPDYK